ncbi:MAG: hypothetical protein HY291_02330 [Planctomycetes bacterium]|nr:hypothetical protein [Planctomycetota bacterium]
MLDLPRCLRTLARWSRAAERWWCDLPGGLGFYGTGYEHWGVQTNQKYAGAMAVLAEKGAGVAGLDRDWARARALAAFRFSLATHRSGDLKSADGRTWGHTWITVLGLERMLYGVRLLAPHLTANDRAALERVVCSEAAWLAKEHERGGKKGVFGSAWAHEGANAPESNLWNGAFLWRAAALYPDHRDAANWREMAHRFLINAVSVPADASCEAVVAGKPVRERFAGPNFFPNYALDHHGYMNVGYMMICASNAGILHFDLKSAGLPRPESLDWHEEDLWRVLRRMVFADGRLARIGGDSRVRYTYCQEYLPPAALYAADRLGDPHALGLVQNYLKLVEQEFEANEDGSFYGTRLREMAAGNPYYYTRLESDRACALAMTVAFAPLVKAPEPSKERFETSVQGGWIDPEHGAVLHRSPKRLAAFSWRSYGLGQGMCQPPDDGHLADWQQNLGGSIEFACDDDGKHHRKLLDAKVAAFEGGFLASGSIMEGVDLQMAEGWRGTDSGTHRIVFVALPDGQTVVGIEHAVCGARHAWLRAVFGMNWLLPNDIFNGNMRVLDTERGTAEFESPPPAAALVSLGSRWACLDGKVGALGLYGGDTLSVQRVPQRRGGKYRSLHVEAFAWPGRTGLWAARPGEALLDCAWMAVSSASTLQMRELAKANTEAGIDVKNSSVRALQVTGTDGRAYCIAANLASVEQTISGEQLFGKEDAIDLSAGNAHKFASTIRLDAGAANVFLLGARR